MNSRKYSMLMRVNATPTGETRILPPFEALKDKSMNSSFSAN